MAFTTQALASVAYQVGSLAGHTLRMLDLQAASLRQVEARVNTLGQVKVVGGLLVLAPKSSAPLGHVLLSDFYLNSVLHGSKQGLPTTGVAEHRKRQVDLVSS